MASQGEIFTVGIIGTGVGIRTHAAGFTALPGVTIIGVAGTSVERSRLHLEAGGFNPNLACSFDDLLTVGPRLVVLATPPAERAAYLPKLAECNSALLVEKPIAPDVESALNIYQSIANRSFPAFLNTQLRGLPAFRSLKSMVTHGKIGRVYAINIRERSPALLEPSLPAWKQSLASGGSQRLSLGPHLLDLGLYLTNKTYGQALKSISQVCGTELITTVGEENSRQSDTYPAQIFAGELKIDECSIQIFTTGVAKPPRLLEFDIEGSEGMLRFSFQNGIGTLTLFTDGRVARYMVDASGRLVDMSGVPPQLNPSLFRVAFPHYASDIIATCSGHPSGGPLTSITDGIASMILLEGMK